MRRRFSSQFLGMNSIAVYQSGAALLVDPGVFPPELNRIREFLDKEGMGEVNILLTHTHGDHIAGWNAFRNYPVYAHECVSEKPQAVKDNDVRYLQGIYRKQGYKDLEHLIFPQPLLTVKEGEWIEVYPHRFAFYHVPGHSTDMTAIVFPEENLICCGDMLIQAPVPFILHSIRQYWNSLEKLKILVLQYNVHCLIAGHGKPAESREEILGRIGHEQKYIRNLVETGIQFLKNGLDDGDLKMRLYSSFPQFHHLHSHQTNVQTFLREQQDITLKDFMK